MCWLEPPFRFFLNIIEIVNAPLCHPVNGDSWERNCHVQKLRTFKKFDLFCRTSRFQHSFLLYALRITTNYLLL